MDWDSLCFNTATLIAGVFVLEYGADKFIDHTVIVGGGDGGDLPPEAMQHTRPGATPGPSRQDSYGPSSVRSGASTPAPSIVGYGNATAQGYNRGVGENIGGSSLQGKEFNDYKDKY